MKLLGIMAVRTRLYVVVVAVLLVFIVASGGLLRAAQRNYIMVVLTDQLWQASAVDTYRFSDRALPRS